MHVLVTCKFEEDPIKMKALERPQHFFHYKSMFSPDAQGQLTPQSIISSGQFELNQDFMVVFVACQNEDDSIKS